MDRVTAIETHGDQEAPQPLQRVLPKYMQASAEPARSFTSRRRRKNHVDIDNDPDVLQSVPQSKDRGLRTGSSITRAKADKACVYCKRSHMTCEKARPCQRCVKRGISHLCMDDRPGVRGRPKGSRNLGIRDEEGNSNDPTIDNSANTTITQPGSGSPSFDDAEPTTSQSSSFPQVSSHRGLRNGDSQSWNQEYDGVIDRIDVRKNTRGDRDSRSERLTVEDISPLGLATAISERPSTPAHPPSLFRPLSSPIAGGTLISTSQLPLQQRTVSMNEGDLMGDMLFSWSPPELSTYLLSEAVDMTASSAATTATSRIEPWNSAPAQTIRALTERVSDTVSRPADGRSSSSTELDTGKVQSPSSGNTSACVGPFGQPIVPARIRMDDLPFFGTALGWGLSDHPEQYERLSAQVEQYLSGDNPAASGGDPESLEWLVPPPTHRSNPLCDNSATSSGSSQNATSNGDAPSNARQQDRAELSHTLPSFRMRERQASVEREKPPPPWNYTYSYAKINRFISRHWKSTSIDRVTRVVSTLRPYFLSIIHDRTDLEIDIQTRTFQTLIAQYEDAFAYIPCPTLIWRRTGEIVGANERMARLLGLDRSDLTLSATATIYDLLEEDSAVRMFEDYGRCCYPTMAPAKPFEGFTTAVDSWYTIKRHNTPASRDQSMEHLAPPRLVIKCSTSLMVYMDSFGVPVLIVCRPCSSVMRGSSLMGFRFSSLRDLHFYSWCEVRGRMK